MYFDNYTHPDTIPDFVFCCFFQKTFLDGFFFEPYGKKWFHFKTKHFNELIYASLTGNYTGIYAPKHLLKWILDDF